MSLIAPTCCAHCRQNGLSNLYYKRVRLIFRRSNPIVDSHACQTAATAKACYICYKPTVTVLATIDTADFFYTCPTHLTDHGFATRAPDPEPEPKKPSVSPEEIAKVKEEWERKQRQKKDKEGQADGDGKNGAEGAPKDAEGKEADVATKADSKQEKKPVVAQGPSSPEEPTTRPTHERYIVHRDIFALRTADHRRRRQAAQTKNLAPRLPGAPRGSLP
ncbi:AAA-ATPase Vps4-associated protein 1-domain-containing protein [Boletus reticuloceps]|uniref:AAA-ATPase Vps4-associated protein 1-domain-containing protein n=1 Tax=Boletus reticuloceps TaxID=495285 RepID=A0A8I2YTF9_9AGAM|nr:AAA-ATPase Vps4-associated protein 1-domain-containing protein [Boletus reticuloceps]